MEAPFWHERWANNQIGFHESAANRLLVDNWPKLNLELGSRVFVPLCGKTLDIHWLLSQGFQVAAAELSEVAISQLFTELNISPTIEELGSIKHYHAANIDVFVGNIFDVSPNHLGRINAVYDRAAMVALPDEMRARYAQHLQQITYRAPILLVTYEYDQTQHAGPPFSIATDEVRRQYEATYRIEHLSRDEVAGGLKGKCESHESVWLLSPR